jgi:hypothetical protein
MFDNVAFNVVIGLVFIYLLYSLLVTTIGELVSTKLGIRARLLRIAVERMFNDGYLQKIEGKKHKWLQGWLRKNFLYEADEFKKSFAGLFYDYPAIKYLGRIEDNHKGRFSSTKPSYFSSDYFADTLINFLADKGTGVTAMDKIAFCLKFNTYHIQPKTLQQFRSLFESAGGNENVYKQNIIKWFNETMDRANGWHKRKMRTISFWLALIIAASFNVDSIRIAKILANDKEARNQLVNIGVALSKDSASRYKDFVKKNGDTVHSSAILDTGFTRITKDINAANVILGLGWGFSDSLTSDNMSFKSDDSGNNLFQKNVNSLNDLIQKKKNTINHLDTSSTRLAINKQRLDSLINDTIISKNKIRLFANDSIRVRDSMQAVSGTRFTNDTNLIKHIEAETNIILAEMRTDSGSLVANNILSKILYDDINKVSGKKYMLIDSIQSSGAEATRIIYGKRRYSFREKLAFIFSHILWYNLIGFIITAFALSLGAPFWFDLLNKIVSIRGVGVKPEEKKKKLPTEPDNALGQTVAGSSRLTPQPTAPVEDVVEEAVRTFSPQLRKIPGVKSVFSVVVKGVKQLQINVDNALTKTEVTRQFQKFPVGNIEVPYSVIDSGIPKTHEGPEGVISNKSGKNGFGSVGCMIQRKDTGSIHILSCWHVMKGNTSYSIPDDLTTILDNGQRDFAERWAGGIFEEFDYGIASRLDNVHENFNDRLKAELGLTQKITFREVNKNDIQEKIRVKYYDSLSSSERQGFIFASTNEVDITYLDRTRTIKDVLMLTGEDGTTISKEGNSGSIVFDENNFAIAMIISGDLLYTYAVKLSHIFRIHNEMIIA